MSVIYTYDVCVPQRAFRNGRSLNCRKIILKFIIFWNEHYASYGLHNQGEQLNAEDTFVALGFWGQAASLD